MADMHTSNWNDFGMDKIIDATPAIKEATAAINTADTALRYLLESTKVLLNTANDSSFNNFNTIATAMARTFNSIRRLTASSQKIGSLEGNSEKMIELSNNVRTIIETINSYSRISNDFNIEAIEKTSTDMENIARIIGAFVAAYRDFSSKISEIHVNNYNVNFISDIAKSYKTLIRAFISLGKDSNELAGVIGSVEAAFASIWRAVSQSGILQAKEILDKLSALVLSLASINVPVNADETRKKISTLAKSLEIGQVGKILSEDATKSLSGIAEVTSIIAKIDSNIDVAKIVTIVNELVNLNKALALLKGTGGKKSVSSDLQGLAQASGFIRSATESLSGMSAVPTTAISAAQAITAVIRAITQLEKISDDNSSKKLFADVKAAFNGMISVFNQKGVDEAAARISMLMGAFASLVTVGVKGNQIGTIFGSIFDAIRKSSTEAADVTEKTVARIKNAINIATKAAEEEDLVVGRIGIKTMPTYVNTLTLGQAPASAVTSALDKVRRIYDALIVRADLFSSTYGKSWDVISNKANIAITNTEKEIAVMDILNKIKTHTPENIVLQSVDNQVKSINENIQALKLFQNELNKTTEDRKKYLETALMLINIDTELGKSASEVFKADPSSFTRLKSQIDMNEKNINIEQELVKMTSVEIKQQEQLLKIAKDKNIELVNMSKYLGVPKPVANLNATGNRLSNDTSTEINRLSSVMDVLSSANIRQQYTAEELSNAYRVLNNEISMNAQWRKTLVTSLNSEIDKLNVELKSLIASGQATSQQSTNLSVWISGLRELSATTLIDANSFITLQGSSIAAANGISSLTSKTEKYNTVLLSSEETLGQLNTRFAEMKIAGNAGVDVEAAKRAASLLTVVESTIKRIDLLSKEMRTGDMTPASRAELASLLEMQSRFGVIRTEIIGLVSGMKDFNTVSQKSAENIESLARIMAKDIIPLTTDKKTIWVGGGGTGGTGGGGGGGNIPGGTNPDIEKETVRLIKLTEARIDNMEAAKANGLATLREAEEMRLSGVSMQTNIDALNNSSREILKRKLALETMIQVLQREAQAGNISRKVMEQLTIRMRESVNATGELGSMLKMQAASFKKFKDSARDAGEEIASTVAMQMRQFTSFTLLFGIMSSVRETFNKMVEESKYLGIALSASRSDVDSLSERLEILHDTMDRMRVKFGASSEEIGRALYQMGSAGLNMKDTLASIEPIMKLIVGTGAEANDIAKTMAATFNVLSYQGALTGNSLMDLAHIADVTAAIFRDNQMEIDEFTNALKYTLPIAHLVGVSFEELSAILGTLHNQGIKAGQAGRSLRSVFFSIAQNREKFERAFADLGIEIDPSGPLKFMDILDQLGDKLGRGAISVSRLEQVVGALNMRGTGPFLLLAQGAGLLKQNLSLAKDGADGAAGALAKMKTELLAGQIKIMNENLFVFSKTFIGWFVKGIEYLIQAFNKLAEVIRVANEAFGGLPGNLLSLIGLLTGIVGSIALIRQVFLGVIGLIIYLNRTITGFIATTSLATGSITLENAALQKDTISKELNAIATANLSRENKILAASAILSAESSATSGFANNVKVVGPGFVGAAAGAAAPGIGAAAAKTGLLSGLFSTIITQLKSIGTGFMSVVSLIKTHWVVALIVATVAVASWIVYLKSASKALADLQGVIDDNNQLLQDMAAATTENIRFQGIATTVIDGYKRYNKILKETGSSATELAKAHADLNNLLIQNTTNPDIGSFITVDNQGNLSLAVKDLESMLMAKKELARLDAVAAGKDFEKKRYEQVEKSSKAFLSVVKDAEELERKKAYLARTSSGSAEDNYNRDIMNAKFDPMDIEKTNKAIIDLIFSIRKLDNTPNKRIAQSFEAIAMNINDTIRKVILATKELSRELVSFGKINIYKDLAEQSEKYKFVGIDLSQSIADAERLIGILSTGANGETVDLKTYIDNVNSYLEKHPFMASKIPLAPEFDSTAINIARNSMENLIKTISDMNMSKDFILTDQQAERLEGVLDRISAKYKKGIIPSKQEAYSLLTLTSQWAEEINSIRSELSLEPITAWILKMADGFRKGGDASVKSLTEGTLLTKQMASDAESFARAMKSVETPVFGALAPAIQQKAVEEDQLKQLILQYTKLTRVIGNIPDDVMMKKMAPKSFLERFRAQTDVMAGLTSAANELAGDMAAVNEATTKDPGSKLMTDMKFRALDLKATITDLNHQMDVTITTHRVNTAKTTQEYNKVAAVGDHIADQLEYKMGLEAEDKKLMADIARITDVAYLNGIAYLEERAKFSVEALKDLLAYKKAVQDLNMSYMESVGKLMEAAEGQRTIYSVMKDMMITYDKFYNLGKDINALETRRVDLLEKLRRTGKLDKKEQEEIYSIKWSVMDMERQRIDYTTEYLNQLREMRGIIAEINNLYKEFLGIQKDAIQSMASVYEERLSRVSDAFSKIIESMASNSPSLFAIKTAVAMGSLEGITMDTSDAIQEMVKELEEGSIQSGLMGMLFGNSIGGMSKKIFELTNTIKQLGKEEAEITKKMAAFDINILSQILGKGIDKITMEDLGRAKESLSSLLGYSKEFAKVDPDSALELYRSIASIAGEMAELTLMQKDELILRMGLDPTDFYRTLDQMTKKMEDFIDMVSKKYGGLTIQAYGLEGSKIDIKKLVLGTLQGLLAELLDKRLPMGAIVQPAQNTGNTGYASGGMVPGGSSAQGDIIPAMLTPGEFVIPADVVSRVGVGNFMNLISGGHGVMRFAEGGYVGDTMGRFYGYSTDRSDVLTALKAELKYFEGVLEVVSPYTGYGWDRYIRDSSWDKDDIPRITKSQYLMGQDLIKTSNGIIDKKHYEVPIIEIRMLIKRMEDMSWQFKDTYADSKRRIGLKEFDDSFDWIRALIKMREMSGIGYGMSGIAKLMGAKDPFDSMRDNIKEQVDTEKKKYELERAPHFTPILDPKLLGHGNPLEEFDTQFNMENQRMCLSYSNSVIERISQITGIKPLKQRMVKCQDRGDIFSNELKYFFDELDRWEKINGSFEGYVDAINNDKYKDITIKQVLNPDILERY
jgi:TP901 family phage tail tape measure protein